MYISWVSWLQNYLCVPFENRDLGAEGLRKRGPLLFSVHLLSKLAPELPLCSTPLTLCWVKVHCPLFNRSHSPTESKAMLFHTSSSRTVSICGSQNLVTSIVQKEIKKLVFKMKHLRVFSPLNGFAGEFSFLHICILH